MANFVTKKRVALFCGVGLSVFAVKKAFFAKSVLDQEISRRRVPQLAPLYASNAIPPRSAAIKSMQQAKLDVLIIGAGATGSGCALDAATRGLSTAIVDRGDFAGATSSKSTKLIHGGVRYLQKAVFNLDKEQYDMVAEGLEERFNLLANAPHCTNKLATMIPVFGSKFEMWKLPYFFTGMKLYDAIAGKLFLENSSMHTAARTRQLFPNVNPHRLLGSVIYYDGQQNDARTNLELALTSGQHGAHLGNYVEVTSLIKEKSGDGESEVISGAKCIDKITGEAFEVHAKCVINATGPYTDKIRQMSDPKAPEICVPTRGSHVTLPANKGPPAGLAVLQPETEDGRVVFIVPWQGKVIAGTTDIADTAESDLKPTTEEVDFIVRESNLMLNDASQVEKKELLSVWTGLRPLIKDPHKTDTQSLVRNHIVIQDKNKLLTIAGGKWTTYRAMAEETIDKAVKDYDLPAKRGCITRKLPLHGSYEWYPTLSQDLSAKYDLPEKTTRYLVKKYGDQACTLLENAKGDAKLVKLKPLLENFPHKCFEQEVQYCVRHEFAETLCDVLARRLGLTFLDRAAALRALGPIAEIMACEKQWSKETRAAQIAQATEFINTQHFT